jgi:hypothetical protein
MTAPSSPPPSLPASIGWLAERAAVPEPAWPLVAGAADGASLVQALLAGGHAGEAVRVMAAALPPREGVWWAWVSARHAAQLGAARPEVTDALAAVERWVAHPDEEHRRAAWAASERVGLESPAGCAAAAAFFTGGSVAPPDVSPVPPPPGVHGTLIAAAVALSAAAAPETFDALLGAYVAQGVEIVKRLGGWDQSVALARQHFEAQRVAHERVAGAKGDGGAGAPGPSHHSH